MRLKTIRAAVDTLKASDTETAVSVSTLNRLLDTGMIAFERHGNRRVVDYDGLIRRLRELLGLGNNSTPPHIRTIDGALSEVRKTMPEIGIGEERLRELIKTGIVPSLHVGNRCYIPLELFHPPYDKLLARDCYDRAEDSGIHYRHKSYADEQIDELLTKQAMAAKVRRT